MTVGHVSAGRQSVRHRSVTVQHRTSPRCRRREPRASTTSGPRRRRGFPHRGSNRYHPTRRTGRDQRSRPSPAGAREGPRCLRASSPASTNTRFEECTLGKAIPLAKGATDANLYLAGASVRPPLGDLELDDRPSGFWSCEFNLFPESRSPLVQRLVAQASQRTETIERL
jgi:hypothetical protein